MDHHARGLVEHDQVLVLVHDSNRNGLWLRRRRRRRRNVDLVRLAGSDRGAGPQGSNRPRDATVLDQTLHVGARLVGKKRGQKVIEPGAVLIGLDDEPPRALGGHQAARARRASACGAGLSKRRPRTISMMIESGTMMSDRNCDVENIPTVPRVSPR